MARGVAKAKVKVLRQAQDDREEGPDTPVVAPETGGPLPGREDGEGEARTSVQATTHNLDPRKRITRIRAGALHAALKDVTGVIGAAADIPVLRHVLFQATDCRIVLTGTDLDIWVTRELASDDRDGPASADWIKAIRPFTVTMPGKALAEVVGSLDGDAMVEIEAPADLTDKYSGQVTIKAGRARFKLHCLPAAEFPMVPHFPSACSFAMPASALADAFAAVEHAISTEETRYYLNGIYLHPAQDEGAPLTLRLAATDGHRLARLAIVPPEGAACLPPAIIARRSVALLHKLLTAASKGDGDLGKSPATVEVEVEEGAGRMRFSLPAADGGDIALVAKTIDGTYPDYARVIPSVTAHSVVIARDLLDEALRRVMVLAQRESRSVKASFAPDVLRLTVSNPDLGEAVEELPCEYEGPELTIGFNGKFWRDALAALASDNVEIGFSDEIAPVVLVGFGGAEEGRVPRFVLVLMPMRVA